MLGRLRHLFRRYADHHQDIACPGFALVDERGQTLGYVEEVRIRGLQVAVQGWADAEAVSLVSPTGEVKSHPQIYRLDVLASRGEGSRADVGFALERPLEQGAMRFCVETEAGRYFFPLPQPGPRALAATRRRLWPGFLAAMVRAAPSVLRWQRTADPRARTEIKHLLGLGETLGTLAPAPDKLFLTPEDEPRAVPELARTGITLILPVYNAFDLLPDVLDRIARHTDLPWHLVIIEDCSSDARVRPFLRDWVGERDAKRITLIENTENQGFIRSVNAAFKLALKRGKHVVLINSDAFVPRGWASRLIRPMLVHDNVASVTPMSNDAEIFSVPAICQKTQIEPGMVDRIDETAARFNPDVALADASTGVGFCMALNIDYLRDVPEFDTAFGRGYGEEVDWCQRVRQLGGRHLGLAGLFVEHRGGVSFGSAEKLKLVRKNNAIVAGRYPAYDAEVQRFIREDPLSGPRVALAIAMAGARQDGPVPIYLAHAMGGGAEKYLERRIAEETAAGGMAVVLRVGGGMRWQVELWAPEGVSRCQSNDLDLVITLLQPLETRHIVYSCGVGAPDPFVLPEVLRRLKAGADDTIEILFHDFFPLSPSYTLLDRSGRYAGVPDSDSTDPQHQTTRADGTAVSLAEWRSAWGALIAEAETLVVFSRDSAAHVEAAYPEAGGKIAVRPHRLLSEVPRVKSRSSGKPVIGVLGNIGYQKGAAVLGDLARMLEGNPAAGLVLIGNIDPAYPLPASVPMHGDYRIEDIQRLVTQYAVTHWLIPSIWPETFSFTTHEALATGLPVFCFDLGAQAEAAAAAPNGHVVALAPEADRAERLLKAIAHTMEAQAS